MKDKFNPKRGNKMEKEYASMLEVKQLSDELDDLKRSVDEMKNEEIVFILDEPHFKGCCYGQADGPDGFIKECDCDISWEDKIISKADEIKKQIAAAKFLNQESQRHLDMAADARSECNCVEEALRTLKTDLLKMLGE